jgi:hypothetical protein
MLSRHGLTLSGTPTPSVTHAEWLARGQYLAAPLTPHYRHNAHIPLTAQDKSEYSGFPFLGAESGLKETIMFHVNLAKTKQRDRERSYRKMDERRLCLEGSVVRPRSSLRLQHRATQVVIQARSLLTSLLAGFSRLLETAMVLLRFRSPSDCTDC